MCQVRDLDIIDIGIISIKRRQYLHTVYFVCARFGMVTMDTDVEELLGLVSNCGRDIDDAVSQLENLSEVVKKGMQQAQDELRKEADNQIWQEGILR